MLNVIYAIKICLLIMYSRLTLGLNQQIAVRYLSIYVGMGWLATELAFFLACRPFSGYWAVPPPSPQCATLQRYAITQAIFNMSSDLIMILIPLPLVLGMTIPRRQKTVLAIIFGMGIFVIIAALLTKVYNLSNVWDPSYMLWYTRESSVAIYVSSLPLIWPLIRRWIPWFDRSNSAHFSASNPCVYPTHGQPCHRSSSLAAQITGIPLSVGLRPHKDGRRPHSDYDTVLAMPRSSKSQEYMRSADTQIRGDHGKLGDVQNLTTVHIRKAPMASLRGPMSAFDIGMEEDVYGWERAGQMSYDFVVAADVDDASPGSGVMKTRDIGLPSAKARTTLSQSSLAVGNPTAKPLSRAQDANINEQLKQFETSSWRS